MLLKVLAVSDVIIFRTRAERLQRDMYSFLGGASKAYKDHFAASLQKAMGENASGGGAGFGPGVVVFHETRHTQTLHESAGVTQSAEDILQVYFYFQLHLHNSTFPTTHLVSSSMLALIAAVDLLPSKNWRLLSWTSLIVQKYDLEEMQSTST
ncbi:unnamed protein product [Acanthoscelides obtectus]|nr:unnamed protein product [Acanthoscelides obtectus]CAK1623882.1 Zinc finger FYVE domain-containing protein 1 [Acanthoscelides obtectus]